MQIILRDKPKNPETFQQAFMYQLNINMKLKLIPLNVIMKPIFHFLNVNTIL